MTDIADARNFIQEEETRFRAPTSESMFTRVGAANNFIMNRMRSTYMYEFAGPYRPLNGGEGGSLTGTRDFEIVGLGVYLRNSGASGSTVLDLHLVNNDTDQGSQWSTKLTLPSNGGIVTAFVDYVTATSQSTAGVTLPAFTTRDFSAFDVLRIDVDSNAVGANDLIINIEYRPR